jgi:hypothetical protein
MVKVNSTFDKLEEGIFDTPIATSPHVGHTSESAPAFSQPQYERPFYYYFDQHGRVIAKTQSKLASRRLKPIGPVQEGQPVYLLVRDCLTVILIKMANLFLGRNLYWSLRCPK